ncbi:hypothetical protein HanXRQr2_Chr08g0329951 [Helianthus annuus]|uniref:Uncharacterized protein n=1 Tax=Helianthus annuus TaxID=4232 RepID=A0A9K3NBS1_HELAN|nr:hypothetical protein HanXRQr2_Chr08g0329951 [Helianthus annuus]KAJ0900903.1 hypothetical protein HanPSC8_Chr08g0319081 [Helianthus annuus]
MDKTIETKSLSNFQLITGEIIIWNKRYIELQLSAPFHTFEMKTNSKLAYGLNISCKTDR